jgi:hypothetical protein
VCDYTINVGAIDLDQLRFIEAALAAVGPGDSANRARLLSVMGLETIWDDPGLRRLDLSDEAVGIARRLGDDACLLDTWTAAHLAGSVPDQIAKLLREVPGLMDLAERRGDAPQQATVCAISVIHYVQLADLEKAQSLMERIDQLAKEFDHPFLRWIHADHRCSDQTIYGTGKQIEAPARLGLPASPCVAGRPRGLVHRGRGSRACSFHRRRPDG